MRSSMLNRARCARADVGSRYGRRARCGCQARCGVAEPVTVLDALEHVLSRARCARPLSSSPRLDEDDDIGVNPYNAF
jgi:hypothetical protein